MWVLQTVIIAMLELLLSLAKTVELIFFEELLFTCELCENYLPFELPKLNLGIV